MASVSSPKPSRVKVREHRERLRAQGLRPIQIWVPDVRARAFRSEAHRQLWQWRRAPMRARIRRSSIRFRTGAPTGAMNEARHRKAIGWRQD